MDQKAHVHSILPEKNTLKPMRLSLKYEKKYPTPESDFSPFEPPALGDKSLTHPHSFARTHLRTHDTNTKRNRNQFPDWGQLR